jgi:hypothetical protein
MLFFSLVTRGTSRHTVFITCMDPSRVRLKAFIHVASSVYKELVLCSSSAKRKIDSKELDNLQVQALESAKQRITYKCKLWNQ